jgi:hypothetical protein
LTVDLFLDSNLVAEGYFRRETMTSLLDDHVSGRVDHNYRLWLLLNLELWHRLFIEGRSENELNAMLLDLSGQREKADRGGCRDGLAR